jgi:predicted 3-demethylubiquinone-9 3-methyltransferase (glyoxalase superfamily)
MATQKITPCLWIENDAKKAVQYYLSIFKDGKLKSYQAYKDTSGGSFDFATMEILGMELQILGSGSPFKFNEAVSLSISCKDQKEVDYYWKALTAKGGSEAACGWLKDKYGLSWQIVPVQLAKLMSDNNKAKRTFVLNAMLKMKKIIIADLEEK